MSQDAVSNNVFTYNNIKSSHRNLYINKNTGTQFQSQEKQIKISEVEKSKNSEIKCPKKKLIIILSLSFLDLIIIAGIIIIIGNYKFGWFMKKITLWLIKQEK